MTNVLLVGRDEGFIGFLQNILENLDGCTVCIAGGANAALHALDTKPAFVLIMADENMPICSGVQLFDEVRNREVFVPFILMAYSHFSDDFRDLRYVIALEKNVRFMYKRHSPDTDEVRRFVFSFLYDCRMAQ